MDPSLLKPGRKLEIYVPSIDAYYQLLVSFLGKKTITVKEIREQQKIREPSRIRLPENQSYPLYIWDKNKVYSGNTKILQRREEGGSVGYVIERPYDYDVKERRQYIRISYRNKIKYNVANDTDASYSKTAQSLDLSGGGMRLIVSDNYAMGTILDIKIEIEKKEINIKSKIVWAMQKKKQYWIGVLFQDMPDEDKELIIDYVFSKKKKWLS